MFVLLSLFLFLSSWKCPRVWSKLLPLFVLASFASLLHIPSGPQPCWTLTLGLPQQWVLSTYCAGHRGYHQVQDRYSPPPPNSTAPTPSSKASAGDRLGRTVTQGAGGSQTASPGAADHQRRGP